MARLLGTLALAIACALLVGCSSNDSPTSPDSGGSGGGGRTVKANPSFATDIQEIFNRRGCSASNCHGAAQSSGLDLRAGTAYGQLVNVAVLETSGTRVIPNDPDNSYLIKKVNPNPPVGSIMPAVGAPLDSIDIQNLRNWISTGAPNN